MRASEERIAKGGGGPTVFCTALLCCVDIGCAIRKGVGRYLEVFRFDPLVNCMLHGVTQPFFEQGTLVGAVERLIGERRDEVWGARVRRQETRLEDGHEEKSGGRALSVFKRGIGWHWTVQSSPDTVQLAPLIGARTRRGGAEER